MVTFDGLQVPEDLPIDDWDRFVIRHQKLGNHVIHFISMFWFYGGPVAAVVYWDPLYVGLFFMSGVLGAFGHWAYDDGAISLREMTSQPEVPGYVVKMFWRMARGQWGEDTRRAQAAVRRVLDTAKQPALSVQNKSK